MKKISRFFSIFFVTSLLLWAASFFNVATSAPVQAIDALGITKSDGLEQVTAGDGTTHTYTIRVTNTGNERVRGVVVADTWPSAFTRGTVTTTRGSCNNTATGFTCNIGNMNAGVQATISAPYTVPPGTPAGAYTNTAVATATEGSQPVTVSDVNTVLTEADVLLVSKTDNPDPVYSGNILTYHLTVANHGPSNASAVVLTDTLPAGTAYDDGLSTTACQSSATPGTVTCSLGTMAAGSEQQVEIKVHVTPSAAGTIHNTASVASGTGDPNSNNNANDEDTTVIVDAIPPVVNWMEPVSDGRHFPACRPDCKTIHFEADATDENGVLRVRFRRWDHVQIAWVEIGDDFTEPYSWEFDTAVLPIGVNQFFAVAYDLSGQPSPGVRIFVDKWLERFLPIIRN